MYKQEHYDTTALIYTRESALIGEQKNLNIFLFGFLMKIWKKGTKGQIRWNWFLEQKP